MNWPTKEITSIIKNEIDPKKAFAKILEQCEKELKSEIWDSYKNMNIERDIAEAKKFILKQLERRKRKEAKGRYFGLDTLNMNDGHGMNLQIGFHYKCDPSIMDMEWTYDCKHHDEHLIAGLYEVSDTFASDSKWSSEERDFAEYTIFLGYSGIVLREALLSVEGIDDFISAWGFHDGDMFFLVQSQKGNKKIISDILPEDFN